MAVFAGLLLTAAFPKLGIAGCAWVAPGLLAAAALGQAGGERFRIGFVGGLSHYLSMLYWLLLIPYRWHGIPLAPAVGWLALSSVLALFTATWVWLVGWPKLQSEVRGSKPEGLPGSAVQGSGATAEGAGWAFEGVAQLLPATWMGRLSWGFSGAAAWVALEMVMARVLGGFPWDLLGVSQYGLVPLIQIASWTGVYGVSFLVAWVSLSLLAAAVGLLSHEAARSAWVGELLVPVLLTAVAFNLGFRAVRKATPLPRTLRATLIQPSIPQTVIWDPGADTKRFRELVRFSDEVLTNATDLLIWPESAVPKLLRYDKDTFEAITGLAQRHKVWMIIGSDDAEPRRGAGNPDEADYFNSSFLISPEGKLLDRYVKRNLVIFGEYLPLQHWLPFLKYFTPIQGGFTPGTGPVEFDLENLGVKTGVLICFEDVFPQLGRSDVRPDTAFLVNITNDGWFGQSAAQWQHAVTALFRAVENGVPLIRCCNNGLTCWIDGRGRIRQVLRDAQHTVYGPGAMAAEIPVPLPGQAHSLTFYTRHGDWFGWGCVAAGALTLGFRLFKRG